MAKRMPVELYVGGLCRAFAIGAHSVIDFNLSLGGGPVPVVPHRHSKGACHIVKDGDNHKIKKRSTVAEVLYIHHFRELVWLFR